MKKAVLLALGLMGLVPVANAQIVIQTPPIPGVTVQQPYPQYPNDYWRRPREEGRREGREQAREQAREEAEWRRRAEYRDPEHSRREWVRAHCVRDWQGKEFCRR